MNFKSVFSSSLFLKTTFVASLCILIFISTISYRHTIALSNSTAQVSHSYEVNLELEKLISYLKDAEAGQRGFILSRDTVFLKPYTGVNNKVNQSFFALKNLTTDNPAQQKNLDSLFTLINLRFTYFEDPVALSTSKKYNEVQLKKNLLDGKKVMDLIDRQISDTITQEMTNLKDKQDQYKDEIFFTPIFTLALLMFSLFVFIFSYFAINIDLTNLIRSNERLLITNESIKHAEEIGGFSRWQWNLEANQLLYSDNQYLLLGCRPKSFEPSIENFLEFVHPSDKAAFSKALIRMTQDKSPSSFFYRIIRKDGEHRYFKSIGKVLTDIKGKKVLICINSDITEQRIISQSLEERNHELEQSNKELASFNHVASHDLQEPLRIIQTYISRIYEKEKSNMSAIGIEYFERIRTAASRMRILIDDLLQFSRTNRVDEAFEKTPLNDLLENAQLELSQIIEEREAAITSNSLPVLLAIPFQIQQLFINLIGNSLKYCSPERKPVIRINCEKVHSRDIPQLKSEIVNKYFKISVTDNGMGFAPEDAEYIFALFYRLHHITDYPGTGIGLSICKKIVENHGGIIYAEGKLNEGSTFTFLLPE